MVLATGPLPGENTSDGSRACGPPPGEERKPGEETKLKDEALKDKGLGTLSPEGGLVS